MECAREEREREFLRLKYDQAELAVALLVRCVAQR